MRGSVIKRGNRWAVVIDLSVDPATGKRQRKWHSGYRTKREAEKARIALLSAVDTGTYIDPSSLTLADYLRQDWLPSRRPTAHRAGRRHRGKVPPSTWATYRRDVETYVIPRLGHVTLQALTPARVRGRARQSHRGDMS